MLRKRSSSILTIRALSKVSPSPLLFHSSNNGSNPQNPLGSDNLVPGDLQQNQTRVYDRGQNPYGFSAKGLNFYKRSNLDHVNQLNPSRYYRGNLVEEVSQVNANRSYRENSGLHQRVNLGEVQRSNLNGFSGENQYGFNAENPYVPQRNDVEQIRRVNSNGFNVKDPNDHQRNNLGEFQKSNLYGFSCQNPDGYQRSSFGGVQQLNSHGYSKDYTDQNKEDGFQKGSSRIGGVEANRFSTGESSQNVSGIYRGNPNEFIREIPYRESADVVRKPKYDGSYMQSPINPREFPQNHSGQAFQQNPNAFYGHNRIGNGELRELQQNPNEHLRISQGQAYQNFYKHNGESPLTVNQQNLSQFPLADGDKSHETGGSVSYQGTLIELDERCKKSEVKEAVQVLALLRKNGVTMDLQRYLMLLQVCGEAESLEEGRVVHNHIYEAMGEVGVAINNKILDMYCKCGSMADAYEVFEKMRQRNLTSWDTMITGLANNNLGEEAIDLFTQYKEIGLQPDGGLFIAVFNACGVLGAVDEGMLHFESMKVEFGIAPMMKHYISIVDMLGRSGYLDEALEFIEKMPVEPSVDVWETLMNLCRVNGYNELGNRCAEIVEKLDSSRLTELTKMGLLPVKASDKDKKRKNNSNLFDFKRHTHELRAGDRSHPENDRIYEQLRALLPNMKEAGYTPNTRLVLHDIDPEARGEALMAHSEKLAAAYCLLTSPARSPMRILKNLRFCTDCHEAMKIISKLTGRFIICRDAKRFHHFENGVCSCKDFY